MEKETTTELTENVSDDHKQKVLKEEIDSALEKICKQHKKWLYMMFFLIASPGILNGMHLMAYVFYVDAQPYYCKIPELEKAGWTGEQIRNVSLPKDVPSEEEWSSPLYFISNVDKNFDQVSKIRVHALKYGCEYYDHDYSKVADMSYEMVVRWVNHTNQDLKTIPCKNFVFESKDSVISEWSLVCDRFIYRSNIQAAYAIGKLLGCSFFGIISDKYGRRLSFTLASLCYVTSALLAPFTGAYSIFLIVRFIIGLSGVGCYLSVFTLLSEMLVGPSKTLICCAFNSSYPVGVIILSFVAYYMRYWKSLQLFMAVPTIVLPFYYWILPESPQWLLSKNRYDEAWKVIQKIDSTLKPSINPNDINIQNLNVPKSEKNRIPLAKKALLPFNKLAVVCSTSILRKRALICFFAWFSVSTTYFGLAMNAQNLNVGRYLYTFLNGILEIISYLLPIPLIRLYGYKTSSMLIFTITGISLLSIMFLPRDFSILILIVALIGRFCDSSAYTILPLLTAELFPTTLRNTAVGASATMSHVGTLLSPYIVDLLGAYIWYIPSTVFGSLCICTIFLLALLPETKNKPMYNTVKEMKQAEKELMLEHQNVP